MKPKFHSNVTCNCPCCQGQYRDCNEARIYGSDLNKYINQECIEEMDTINIDCLQYKASNNYSLRLIEFKHWGETLSKRQNTLLPMLANQLTFWDGRKVPTYTVTGSYPFSAIKIQNMLTRREITIEGVKAVKNWLSFGGDFI